MVIFEHVSLINFIFNTRYFKYLWSYEICVYPPNHRIEGFNFKQNLSKSEMYFYSFPLSDRIFCKHLIAPTGEHRSKWTLESMVAANFKPLELAGKLRSSYRLGFKDHKNSRKTHLTDRKVLRSSPRLLGVCRNEPLEASIWKKKKYPNQVQSTLLVLRMTSPSLNQNSRQLVT